MNTVFIVERRTAVGSAELLCEQREHPRQQDHGGHHTDSQTVRDCQVREHHDIIQS